MSDRMKEIRERRSLNLGKVGGLVRYEDPSFYILLTPEERDWLCDRLEEAEKVIRGMRGLPITCGPLRK